MADRPHETDRRVDTDHDLEAVEPERYELFASPAYRFEVHRRDFFKVLGAGLVVAFGAAAGTGVYDLCFDWSRGSWSLARVLD